MAALAFVQLSDWTKGLWGESMVVIAGFPLFIIGEMIWVWMGLSSLTWISTRTVMFGSPAADFRPGIPGLIGRLFAVIGGWVVILALLALIPAERALMIQPLPILGASAVPVATRLVDDTSPRVRRSAINVLYRIGAPARSSAPAIARHLDDSDQQVRLEAESALTFLAPELLPPDDTE